MIVALEGPNDDGPFDNVGSENSIAYLASPAESIDSGSRQAINEASPPLPDASAVFVSEDDIARKQLSLTLHHMLWDIFSGLFETQVGIWIGSECCPFKHTLTVGITITLYLFSYLTGGIDTDNTHISAHDYVRQHPTH